MSTNAHLTFIPEHLRIERLQWLMLCAIALLAAHQAGLVLWESAPALRTLTGLQAVVLFVFDAPLFLLLLLTTIRLIFSAAYRDELFDSFNRMLTDHGGIFWFALLVWMGVSITWAREPVLVQYAVLHLIAELFMAVILADFVRRGWWKGIVYALVIGASLQTGVAAAQIISGGSLGIGDTAELVATSSGNLRAYGLAINPNNLAGYLMIALFACWMLPNPRLKIALCAWIFAGILITGSRAAVAGVMIGTFVMIGAHLSGRDKLRLLGGMVLTVLILFGLRYAIWDSGESRSFSDEVSSRLFFEYDDTLNVLRHHPLQGSGAHNLMFAIADLNRDNPFTVLLPAHNAFVMIAAELGIPGLLLILLAGGWVFWSNFHLRSVPHPVYRHNRIWQACLLAIVVVMLLDFYFWGDFRSRVMVFQVIGMLWGTLLYDEKLAIKDGE